MKFEPDLGGIDRVLEELDAIIEWSVREENQFGFFAALYRRVTAKIRDGIVAGHFEDPNRMSQFDKIFADRYLIAFRAYQEGKAVSESWGKTFEAVQSAKPLILQQLLLGMNAHINFDLGIAAAEIAPGRSYEDLKNDFFKINQILFENLDPAQNRLGEFSPWLAWLDRFAGGTDEMLARFGMRAARDSAWALGARLGAQSPSERAVEIAKRDSEVRRLGGAVLTPPGLFFRAFLRLIRWREEKKVGPIIRRLAER